MKKTFIIDVVRIGFSSLTSKVEADTESEAIDIAIQNAKDVEMRETSSEYEIGFIEEE